MNHLLLIYYLKTPLSYQNLIGSWLPLLFKLFSAKKWHKLVNMLARAGTEVFTLQYPLRLLIAISVLISGLGIKMEVLGQDLIPFGPEFKVSSTPGYNDTPSAAMDSEGDFVTVWASDGIYARRYNAQGIAQGAEFKVNTTAITNVFRSPSPSVAMNSEGDFVVVWKNFLDTNGDRIVDKLEIYGQRYNAQGITQGSEFKVTTASAVWSPSPSAAMDSDGDFVVIWTNAQDTNGDGAADKLEIYGQRYNAQGITQGSEFKVTTIPGSASSQYTPSIGMSSEGDFVVVWKDLKDTNGDRTADKLDIYARRYNKRGEAQGAEFIINTTTTYVELAFSPAVAMDSDGDFVVVWISNRIYARSYNKRGEAIGAEFIVTPTTVQRSSPSIAMNSDGDFVVIWISNLIYGQRYNKKGEAIGAEFKVNAPLDNQNNSSPSVAMDNDGDFVVIWQNDQDTNGDGARDKSDIYGQRFSYPGKDFKVSSTLGNNDIPSVAMDSDGNFVALWQYIQDTNGDGSPDKSDIYGQRYNKKGEALGTEFKVTTTTVQSSLPPVAMNNEGDFVVVWQNLQFINRNGHILAYTDIYARRYNGQGIALGAEFKVNTTVGFHYFHSAAMNSEGDLVVVWEYHQDTDGDADKSGIYGQRYNKKGEVLGTEFKINTTTKIGARSLYSVAMNSEGDFVVVWETTQYLNRNGYLYGYTDIYGQRYNKKGEVVGTKFKINSTTTMHARSFFSIAMNSEGDFVVVWTAYNNNSPNEPDIYSQRYNKKGETQGTEFKVNTTPGYNNSASVAMNSEGDFVVVWMAYDNIALNNIYGQRYNKKGEALGTEFKVNAPLDNQNNSSPSVAMDKDGNFMVVWRVGGNYFSKLDIYAKLFHVPSNTLLSLTSVAENQIAGTTVGTLATTDLTPGDRFTYALVEGNGSADNAFFEITGDQLKTKVSFDFETKASYYIRVRTTDAQGLVYEKPLVITITDANDAPTHIAFKATSLLENQAVGTTMGSFTTTDADAGASHSYILVTGTGDRDNASFSVEANTLKSNALFDFEVKQTYSIRVETNDGKGGVLAKAFSIVITDINDTPTLDAIADLRLETASVEQTVPLANITSGGEANQVLTVKAISSNTELIPDSIRVEHTSPNPTGTLRFIVASGKSGTAIITVTVRDNGGRANGAVDFIERSFRVTVAGVPQAPALLAVQVNEQEPRRQVDLIWSNVANETGYRIEVSQGEETQFRQLDIGKAANDTIFSHTGLTPGSRYFYRVVAYNTAGDSPASEVIGAITASDIVTALADEAEAALLKLYPTPTSNKLTVDVSSFSLQLTQKCKLAAYDLQGRLVWYGEWKGHMPQTMVISVAGWQAGVYQFVFTIEEKQISKMIVKH
jgi:hypothetical protein